MKRAQRLIVFCVWCLLPSVIWTAATSNNLVTELKKSTKNQRNMNYYEINKMDKNIRLVSAMIEASGDP